MSIGDIEPQDDAQNGADAGLTEEELSEVNGGKLSEFNPQPEPPG